MKYFSPQILDGSVTTAKLANLAVTTAKLDTGAVEPVKLNTLTNSQAGTIIANGQVGLSFASYSFAPAIEKDGTSRFGALDVVTPAADPDAATWMLHNTNGTAKDYDVAWRRVVT